VKLGVANTFGGKVYVLTLKLIFIIYNYKKSEYLNDYLKYCFEDLLKINIVYLFFQILQNQ
jgi:hypothetical protein